MAYILGLLFHLMGVMGAMASEDNFLYSGCSVSQNLRSVLATSVPTFIRYPLEDGFTLEVFQNDKLLDLLTNNKHGSDISRQRWMPMRLIMEGGLELQFQNGTTLLRGKGHHINPVPEMRVNLQEGYLLPDCPQELPNWKVQRSESEQDVLLYDGTTEVFSIITNTETKMLFDIGGDQLFLCWNNIANATVVMPMQNGDCRDLPPFTLIWLQVVYQEQMVAISDPLRPSDLLSSFHKPGIAHKLTFKGNSVNGVAFVVHHIKGFPQATKSHSRQLNNASEEPTVKSVSASTDMCPLISALAGIGAFLIIVILFLFSVLFYIRWINARKILFVLGAQSQPDKPAAAKDCNEGGYNRKPSIPSHSPPSIKKAKEGIYITPRELKNLDDGDDENRSRPKSDHIYEDMVYIGWPKKEQSKKSDAEINKGFVTPANHYEVPRK